MTQQLWSGSPPPGAPSTAPAYRVTNQGPTGYGHPGFGQPPFGGGMPAYGPMAPPPRPRTRHPARTLLLALLGLALVALAGLAVVNLTAPPSQVAYVNDDFEVPPPDTAPPPLPQPDTYQQAEQLITANAFYSQTAPAPVRCDSQPINVTSASDRQLETHFEGLTECLVRVWQPPVTAADYLIVRPTVTVYGDKITTKCGSVGVNAFYCSADQQLYYSNLLPQAIPAAAENKWTADLIMAHEYAHLLQGRTGILISTHALAQRSGDKDTENAYLRRLETQADCFSGMFVRAVSASLGVRQDDLEGIEATYVAIGDDTLSGDPNAVANHGLARSRLFWGNRGLGTSAVGDCNTFSAPAEQVR
ncbi:MAG TPA: neutral zinc metallopeptidase [Propionibacteriaceae bacterium]|nr:neutral zinc metallopeptidase [Propionibacteriaceae bacterium]